MACVLDVRLAELASLSNRPGSASTTHSKSRSRSMSAPEGRTIRKLPVPPSRHHPSLSLSSTMPTTCTRPLPCVPEACSITERNASQTSSVPEPAQPVAFYPASPPGVVHRSSAPAPAQIGAPAKVRNCKAISLQTSPRVLHSAATLTHVPEPLTPVSALRKRTAKLQNFYGETPPAQMLIQERDRALAPTRHSRQFASVPSRQKPKQQLTTGEAAEIARRLKQFELDDLWDGRRCKIESDSEDDSSTDEDGLKDEPFLVKGVAFRAADVHRISKRWSRRWVMETKGRKCEVQDYSLVLQALREL